MAVSPKKQSKNSSSTFKQYEASTEDAWDDGDDDLLQRLKIDQQFIQSTASKVINSHHTSTTTSTQVSSVKASAETAQNTGTENYVLSFILILLQSHNS